MTSYDPLPQKQILSYQVRGPEIEAITNVLLEQRTMLLQSLIEKFVPVEKDTPVRRPALLREAVNFLRKMEFVQQSTDEDQSVTIHLADDVTDDELFALRFLRHLHSFDDDRRAFRLITDLVISKNWFLVRRRDLVTELEVACPGSYSWNVEKVQSWLHLADYAGLVRSMKPDQGDIMVCPQPVLLLTLLAAYSPNHEVPPQVPIGDWLSFVHGTYFSCFTDRQEVHIGLARSLKAMAATGHIEFDVHSDAPSAVSLDGQAVAYLVPQRASPSGEEVVS